MKKQVKTKGNILTVQKILDKEELKDLADKIVSEDIDNIILIYHNVKDNKICYATTVKGWATIFGEMEMIHQAMLDSWEYQSDEEDDEVT